MNEKRCTVFVQDVLHNINLMRIGKWTGLNRICLHLDIPTLLESNSIAFGLVPIFLSAIPGAQESLSRIWRHLHSFFVYCKCVRCIVYVCRTIFES